MISSHNMRCFRSFMWLTVDRCMPKRWCGVERTIRSSCLAQWRKGPPKENGLTTASSSSTGSSRSLARRVARVKDGAWLMIDMAKRPFAFSFHTRTVKGVTCMINVPRAEPESYSFDQMSKPIKHFSKHVNGRRPRNFARPTPSEQALKEPLRKRVRTCEIRRARSIGCKKLHLQALFTPQLSMCFGLANGSQSRRTHRPQSPVSLVSLLLGLKHILHSP